ncbi:alpha/beta hydrolase [Acidisoma cellulosilytica]|uniref:Alpha/beta hydrolase n=1 Tax=Acidisoma cellulosilyticum TaxID=2802395 RepID=A0A963YYF1_9PROT|nr:alpha/beta hydrolase [Acidisoma cellulosilyticum]MCB8879280.1 alpha/beta hydrolase [Acidisoma cellulosilyticum]
MKRRTLLGGLAALPALPAATAEAAPGFVGASRNFRTSDGVNLHYIDAMPASGAGADHVMVFIPGWTMPAWIFAPQLTYFARYCRVIALDPRGQGDSEIPSSGYTAQRRGQDIAELLAVIGVPKVVLIGWSLGVLDSLAYVAAHGGGRLSGLVLIDNSVGENPPPRAEPQPRGRYHRPLPYPVQMRAFVRGMFRTPQSQAYLDRLTATCLITPEPAARALLNYQVPRVFWRNAVYAAHVPILYVVRPHLSGQAANLAHNDPDAESVIFSDAGHALFVDDAIRFNTVLANFLRQKVWI